jgi:ABC-type transport system involved in cytochrome c biogenesis permease subunit
MPIDKITVFCFAASYAVALVVEILHMLRPLRVERWLRTVMAGAGLIAHTLFLAVQKPPLASQYGSILFLAWILAVFYFFGSLHHQRRAWGIFVLPLVLGLVLLATAFDRPEPTAPVDEGFRLAWGAVHGGLLLLASVGVCVGFVASVMYLVQARKLRAKLAPRGGLPLFSLERLEEMNRRAINLAFPLLTAGVLIGAFMMVQDHETLSGWADPKVLGAIVLWIVFALVLYLRYGLHLSGRRLALLTILAFALLMITLVTPSHAFLR